MQTCPVESENLQSEGQGEGPKSCPIKDPKREGLGKSPQPHSESLVGESPKSSSHNCPIEDPLSEGLSENPKHPNKNCSIDDSHVTSKEMLFLQKDIYIDIIEKLSSKNIRPWIKDCGIKPAHALADNKKLLFNHIEEAMLGNKTLSVALIGRLTKTMNDSAISTELFNFGIEVKGTARARKTQLQNHLVDNFSDFCTKVSPQKTASWLKTRQVKRLRKSLHTYITNQSSSHAT